MTVSKLKAFLTRNSEWWRVIGCIWIFILVILAIYFVFALLPGSTVSMDGEMVPFTFSHFLEITKALGGVGIAFSFLIAIVAE